MRSSLLGFKLLPVLYGTPIIQMRAEIVFRDNMLMVRVRLRGRLCLVRILYEYLERT